MLLLRIDPPRDERAATTGNDESRVLNECVRPWMEGIFAKILDLSVAMRTLFDPSMEQNSIKRVNAA